jgi:hypothetical protein
MTDGQQCKIHSILRICKSKWARISFAPDSASVARMSPTCYFPALADTRGEHREIDRGTGAQTRARHSLTRCGMRPCRPPRLPRAPSFRRAPLLRSPSSSLFSRCVPVRSCPLGFCTSPTLSTGNERHGSAMLLRSTTHGRSRRCCACELHARFAQAPRSPGVHDVVHDAVHDAVHAPVARSPRRCRGVISACSIDCPAGDHSRVK